MEIETPVLLAHAIEDSTDIFGISGGWGGLNTPNPPLDTPLSSIEFGFQGFPGCDAVSTGMSLTT